MADQETTFRLKFENEDMERVFKQMADRIEETDDRLRKLERTQKEAFDTTAKATQAANEQLRKQAANLDANSVRFKSLKDAGSNALDEIENSGNAAVGTLARLGRSAGPIGVAVAAAVGLIASAFLDVEKNADKVRVKIEGIKALGNELKDRVFAGIRGIVKFWSGDIAAASQEYANFLGIGRKSLDVVTRQGEELARQRIAFAKSNQDQIRLDAKRATQLQKNQALLADGNRTTAERIDLIRSSAKLESDLNNSREQQLSKRLQILYLENEVYGEAAARLDEIANIEAEIVELRGASQVSFIQAQLQINDLLQEEAEIRDRIIGQIKDANAQITGQGAERAIQKQIDAFKELRDSVSAAGLADEYAAELSELDRVIEGLQQRLDAGLIKPLEQLPDAINEALQVESLTADPLAESLGEAGIEAAERLGKAFKERFEQLTDDQRRFIEQQFGDIFSSVSDIVISNTIIAIGQQNEIIDARERSISELETQLAEQEDLEDRSRANNAASLRESLQQERQVLRREQQRRLELEKRAARQRLLSNSIQQGSEITLAVTKLLNQGASGFIPGLIAAAGGIALLFRIIAQAKANAAAFSAPPQFREGTEYLLGKPHEQGGILAELEGGERILSKALNEKAGGSQLSNEDLIDFALKGMTAEAAIGPISRSVAAGASAQHDIERAEAEIRNSDLVNAIRTMGAETKKEITEVIKTIRERPNYHPLDQLGIREYWKGGTKYIERITPKKGGKN